jgi:CopG family nickel-responsive transcriptional regulator
MITTINLEGDLLKEVDSLIKNEGYRSRSEVFRAAVRDLLDEKQESLQGESKCVLIMSHQKEKEDRLNKIKHIYDDLVETQMHTHLEKGKCTELFVLSGNGSRIKELSKEFRRNGAEKIILVT